MNDEVKAVIEDAQRFQREAKLASMANELERMASVLYDLQDEPDRILEVMHIWKEDEVYWGVARAFLSDVQMARSNIIDARDAINIYRSRYNFGDTSLQSVFHRQGRRKDDNQV